MAQRKTERMIEYLYRLLNKIILLGSKVTRKEKIDIIRKMLTAFCKAIEDSSGEFVTFRLRPVKAEKIICFDKKRSFEKISIVMQGPIMTFHNFTLESIKLYKKLYPGLLIIVSTWDDVGEDIVSSLEKAGAIVVMERKPEHSGRLNINYQIISTRNGIDKAVELGAEYICKTRTDQRFFHVNAMEYLESLLECFAPNNSDFSIAQNRRIITCSVPYGNLFFPYMISDFIYYGSANEIKMLFDVELDRREFGSWNNGVSRKKICDELLAPEIYLINKYILRHGGKFESNVEKYWEFVRNHLICIDKDDIGLFWPKYDEVYEENKRNGYYYTSQKENQYAGINFDFENWLALYSGLLVYDETYETFTEYLT